MKEDMQQTSDIALKVTNVSKSFKLPTEKSSSLKNSLFNLIRGVHGYTIQEVLKASWSPSLSLALVSTLS